MKKYRKCPHCGRKSGFIVTSYLKVHEDIKIDFNGKIMRLANLKGLGKKQLDFIRKMYNHKTWYVQIMMDLSRHEHEITLSDDDGNDYEAMTELFFQSLLTRKILVEFQSIEPSINLVFTRYRLNEFISTPQNFHERK